jgi:hypothetical protein
LGSRSVKAVLVGLAERNPDHGAMLLQRFATCFSKIGFALQAWVSFCEADAGKGQTFSAGSR